MTDPASGNGACADRERNVDEDCWKEDCMVLLFGGIAERDGSILDIWYGTILFFVFDSLSLGQEDKIGESVLAIEFIYFFLLFRHCSE